MKLRIGGLAQALGVTVAFTLGGQALAQDDQQSGSYTNPVIEPVAADPSLIRAADGTWYLYATQDRWDDGIEHYLPVFASRDLVNWEFVSDVFVFPPHWKQQGFLWAPDISVVDGVYHLYYSYSTWGDPNPCIGLATAPLADLLAWTIAEGKCLPTSRTDKLLPAVCLSDTGSVHNIPSAVP